MDSILQNIQSIILNDLEILGSFEFERRSKTTPTNMLYYLTNIVKSAKESSKTSATTIACNEVCNINASSYRKRRNSISSVFIKMIPDSLRHFAAKPNYNETNLPKVLFNKYRIIGCDGTHSPSSRNLLNDNYKLTKNNTYVNATINVGEAAFTMY